MITIPNQINKFNFVLIGNDGKRPFQKGWQKRIHNLDSLEFQNHIKQDKNYGVQSNNSFIIINAKVRKLIIIDFDTKELQNKVIDKFPETFTTSSNSPKNCLHLWLACDDNTPFKIKDENKNTLADVIGAGNQVIAPGSIHNSGSIYSVVKDLPIAFISYEEIEAILKPHHKAPEVKKPVKKDYKPTATNPNNFLDKLKSKISMVDVLEKFGVDTQKNPTNCIFHHSEGNKCLGFNSETAHCFNCDGSWNIFSFVKKAKGCNSAEAIKWLADFGGLTQEYEENKKEYINEIAEPRGWAISLNIKTDIAEKENFLSCPKCNDDFEFNEKLGWFNCGCQKGGIKKLMEMIVRRDLI